MSDLSVGSPAYNEWVRVEYMRLNLTHFNGEWTRETFERLTTENKKRRLLFAKGRKGDCARKPRKVRW